MATRLYKVGTVSVTNGSNIVTGSGTNWANASDKPQAGDLFSLDLDKLYEITAITNTQITLDRNFAGTTQSGVNYSIVRHSSAGDIQSLNLAISNLINNRESFVDSLDDVVSGDADEVTHVNRFNQSKQIPTLKKARDDYAAVQAQAESLVGSIVLPNQAEFESRYEGKYAGAGFVEWGNHHGVSNSGEIVNEGISTWTSSYLLLDSSIVNNIALGKQGGAKGSSNTKYPVVYVAGSHILVNNATNEHNTNLVPFPRAPDGLDKADGTGRFASLAEAITAGTTTLGSSVIYRQDLCGIEVFDLNVTTSGAPLYPYGSCQYRGSWEGITLSDNLVAQGYSAFYVGDTVTKGKGFLLDLANSNHVKFLQDKRNNCYRNHLGEVIQRQFRIRVIAGLNGDWGNIQTVGSANALKWDASLHVIVQGTETTPKGLENFSGKNIFLNKNHSWVSNFSNKNESGAFTAAAGNGVPATNAYNGNCWFIPVCLVQRRNQGAFDPAYNPAGASQFTNSGGTAVAPWYSQPSAYKASSVSDCFNYGSGYPVNGGNITAPTVYVNRGLVGGYVGRPDGYYYDGIYATDVYDVRMSARKKDPESVKKEYWPKVLKGEVRGREPTPFIKNAFTQTPVSKGNNGTVIYIEVAPNSFNHLVGDYVGGDWDSFHGKMVDNSGNIFDISVMRDIDDYRYIYLHSQHGADTSLVDITGDCHFVGWDYLPYYQDTVSVCEVLATPTILDSAFPDGVAAIWNTQLTATGAQTWKLSKKSIFGLTNLASNSNGTSWGVSAYSTSARTDNLLSSGGSTSIEIPDTYIYLLNYKSPSDFTVPANVRNLSSDISDVIAVNNNQVNWGARLASSVLDKVPVGLGPFSGRVYPWLEKGIDISGNRLDLGSWGGGAGKHYPINIDKADSPAAKYFCYAASSDSGIQLIQVPFRELVSDLSKDNVAEFAAVDGTTSQTYTKNTTYRITGLDVEYVVVRVFATGTSTFNALTPDGKGNWLGDDGVVVFKTWEGTGFGDTASFYIINLCKKGINTNGNTVLYGTHEFTTPYWSY